MRKMTRKWGDKSGVKGQEHLNIGCNSKAVHEEKDAKHCTSEKEPKVDSVGERSQEKDR